MFKNKVLLITGGTGSFGHAVLERFLNSDLKEIRILSRDEKKQDDMRKYYRDPKLKFFIGDVRDVNSIEFAVSGSDYIFHAAALKQVPSCEFYPMEAVKTNILGTNNVLDAAIRYGAKKVVCLSTDKAVYPINAMGISKALMEKVMISKSRLAPNDMVICGTRYGNVMASRGSVIPLFLDQIRLGRPITVTDSKMTRFMMTLDDAVDLVLYAFNHGCNGDIFVQKSPSVSIGTLVKALLNITGKNSHVISEIGIRHGEKLYEVLLSKEERSSAIDLGDYFRVPSDNRDLNYEKFLESGVSFDSLDEEFNSNNSHLMEVDEMASLLRKVSSISKEVDKIAKCL